MIDDHVHPFPLGFEPLELSSLTLDAHVGADADRRRLNLGPTRLGEEMLRVHLAGHLGCAPEDVVALRDQHAAADWDGYVRSLFAAAGTTGMLLDAGWQGLPSGGTEPFARIAGIPVWELARLEPLVDGLIEDGADAADIVARVDAFMEERDAAGAVCFKTVIAYRTGLAVDPGATVEAASRQLAADRAAGLHVRRSGKVLRDLLFRHALGRCAELRRPMQVHTGYGDSDIRLREADPLLLEEVLRAPEAQAADVVLIHASFPWHEQAAYLASVHPRVWTEMSLCNIFSPATTADRLLRLLDCAPAARITLGSDGHGIPESHWFGAAVLRDAWAHVRSRLATAARPAWLDATEASIFEDNARRLYRLAEAA